MFKKEGRFPLYSKEEVHQIEKTLNNTWILLLTNYSIKPKIKYIRHTKADGKDIKLYSIDPYVNSFELVSDSKIFVPEPKNKRILIIDLLKESVKSFPFHFPQVNQYGMFELPKFNYRMFKFRESGFICLYKSSETHFYEYKEQSVIKRGTYIHTYFYFN